MWAHKPLWVNSITAKVINCKPTNLSLTEHEYLVEHVKYLETWLVDGEDDRAVGASHAMEVVQ